jgi:cell shape-determining protein MreC
MATIKFLDPRTTVNPGDRAVASGLDTLEGKVIGIVDNGQSNSTAMFQELAKLLRERSNASEIIFRTKPTHMQGAPKAIMDEMVTRCDAVITGLGA